MQISDGDFAALAKEELNGQEIKSAVKTALILASREGGSLKRCHLDIVVGIRKRIDALETDEERPKKRPR